MKKLLMLLALLSVSGCFWHHAKAKAGPAPSDLIVTGLPIGSILFVDDGQQGDAAEFNDKPRVLTVAQGIHKVEVRLGDSVVYRESTYVTAGEKHVVTVLSGAR